MLALRTLSGLEVPTTREAELDISEGQWRAPFAFRDVVDTHRSLINPRGFTDGQLVPLIEGHNWRGRWFGIGRIETGDREAALIGEMKMDTPEAATFWREVEQAREAGYNVEVSVGMDPWTMTIREELTAAELQLRNEAGGAPAVLD